MEDGSTNEHVGYGGAGGGLLVMYANKYLGNGTIYARGNNGTSQSNKDYEKSNGGGGRWRCTNYFF